MAPARRIPWLRKMFPATCVRMAIRTSNWVRRRCPGVVWAVGGGDVCVVEYGLIARTEIATSFDAQRAFDAQEADTNRFGANSEKREETRDLRLIHEARLPVEHI